MAPRAALAAPLFDVPADLLGPRMHAAVFGELSTMTARALDVPEVAAAVRPLLARGWRPAQLGARVGALPASDDPAASAVALLESLLERSSPAETAARERAERLQRRTRDDDQPVASEESRARWVAEARRSLGRPAPPRARSVPGPSARPCASCGAEGGFFVTREVRLCAGCVELLGSGRARLAVGA